MRRIYLVTPQFLIACALLLLAMNLPPAAVAACTASHNSDVTTSQYDTYRTGANLNETLLTPANVSSAGNTFGYLFSIPVSASPVFAQPLVVHNLTMGGQTLCRDVYVAGLDNSIYAFDGENPPTAATPYIWKTPPFGTVVSYVSGKVSGFGSAGVLSTPVIDVSHGVLYFVSVAQEGSGPSGWIYRLHAVSLLTGAEAFLGDRARAGNLNGGVAIAASVPGTGDDSTGGLVPFVASHQWQRPALLNVNGTIYIGFGFGTSTTNYETDGPYHGWMFAYKSCLSHSTTCATDPPCYSGLACTLEQVSVFNTTPNSHGGGIWMSGRGPAWDGGTNVFVASANACIMGSNPLACPAQESGESVLNLSTADFFSPPASWITTLDYNDLDLDNGGILMIPPASVGATSSYLVSATKSGSIYLLPKSALGGQTAAPYQTFQASGVTAQCPDSLPAYDLPPLGKSPNTGYCDEIHNPAYWSLGTSGLLYIWAYDDILRAYGFNFAGNNQFLTTPAATYSPHSNPGNGGILTVSANNRANAILWSVTAQASFAGGALSAYQLWNSTTAKPVLQKLWDSSSTGTTYFTAQRFLPPVVSNGKVYVTTATPDANGNNQIFVYGLCSSQTIGCQIQP